MTARTLHLVHNRAYDILANGRVRGQVRWDRVSMSFIRRGLHDQTYSVDVVECVASRVTAGMRQRPRWVPIAQVFLAKVAT